MLDFKSVIEKLKDIISAEKEGRKVYDKDVALALAIPQATFATMKKRNSIPFKEIMEFCAMKKLSINWLFFDQAVDMLAGETDKFFKVRYFSDVRASAGGGAFSFDEEYELLALDRRIMENLTASNLNTIEAINVDGESMEPTLQDGSIVLLDREQKNVHKEGIYVVNTVNAGLFIKRVRQQTDGMIELISDNPSYSPERVSVDEIQIVGRVVGNIESL
ncbi:MAG: LexA family transcriptional regulator [Campylobacterales bacterium]|nr:LexA family transcriptional regulator [Campylobacterales bacterium]MBD3843376.1 LexA family transcriptional regulator [Campylobacterales bacterium]